MTIPIKEIILYALVVFSVVLVAISVRAILKTKKRRDVLFLSWGIAGVLVGSLILVLVSAPWTPCSYIRPDDPEVQQLAEQLQTVEDIYYWVGQNIAYELGPENFDEWLYPAQVIQRRSGDCKDMASLLVSLFRAKGIPEENVRVVIGRPTVVVYIDDEPVGFTGDHAWVELLHHGRWLALDPSVRPLLSFNRFLTDPHPLAEKWIYKFNDVYYEERKKEISVAFASVQNEEWVEVGRGRNYIEYQRGDEFKQEIFGGPIHTWDGENWVPWVFEDLGDRYVVQHPHASVKFFDYYTEIWSEHFENVVIYNDQWRVESWQTNKWKDVGFWGVVRSYEIVSDDELRLIRTGDTSIGQRKEIYTFSRGSSVKITISQTCNEAQTIRFIWKPSGIVADKEIKHGDKENRISHLTYYDIENNWIGSLAWFSEFEVVDNIDVLCETDAGNKKATIIFGNFEVLAGENVVLDPTTAFYDTGSDEGLLKHSTVSYADARDATSGDYYLWKDYGSAEIGQRRTENGDYNPTDWYIYRSYVYFDTSVLGSGATITSATLSICVWDFKSHVEYGGPIHFDVVIQDGQPTYPHDPVEMGDFDRTNYSDDGGSWNTSNFTGEGYYDITLNATGRGWINKTGTTKFCLRSSRDISGTEPTCPSPPGYSPNERLFIYLSEADEPPKLTITGTGWTTPTPPNIPSNLKVEDQVSPQRLTTFTPEMSFLYVDNDGDNMQAFQIQVGTSAGNNSMWDNTTTENAENNSTVTVTYAGSTLSRGTQYWWRVRVQDNHAVWSDWSGNENFQINQLPVTTNLKTENQANPARLTTLTPTFSWVFNDADGDNQSHWQIWVGTSLGTNDKWNSGELPGTDNSDVYGGSALSRGDTYYVQIRTKDNLEWSDWATGTFRINQLPTQTYSEQTFYEDYTPTLNWGFSDPDGDSQLGVKIQVDNDPGFGSLLWNYSDNTTTAQSKTYAGEALEKNVTYYARVQVRDGYEWSGSWSDNTFEILSIPSLVVAEVSVDSTPVDRKAHWSGDGEVRIYATVKDNEGRDAIENVHFWIRDNNDTVVVDNAMHVGYVNVNDNTKRLWYDFLPSSIMLDNALGEFDVKVQAVSANFENTKDYTDLGFKLFTVDDHSITFSPVREIYAEGEIITFEPTVKSVASGSAVENAYLKLELISELEEVLRTVAGYTNGSGKLATHTTLLEADVGFYDVRISTGKGAIDGLKLYEDAFEVVAELLVSVESITPADDSVSGLLRSRSVVPEDVVVKVLVFDTAGTELLNLISDSMRVENTAPQLKPWQVPYGLTLAEGTYSYRVEVWESDLGTLHHVAFAEVRLAVAPSQQAVGDWVAVDTIEIKGGMLDVVLYRESIVTNSETVDKANFFFREIVPAPQGSTVMVKVSGMPLQTLSVDQYGTITKYFDVKASTTVRVDMEVTIACAVRIEALGETEVVASSIPRTVKEYEYKVTNLTSTTLRQLELTFPVDDVVSVVDEDGEPIMKFWETESTTVEIPILEPYEEITLVLTAEKTPSIPDILRGLVTWTIYGVPIVIPLIGLGAFVAGLTRKKTGPVSKVILLLLPLIIFLGLWVLGVF